MHKVDLINHLVRDWGYDLEKAKEVLKDKDTATINLRTGELT